MVRRALVERRPWLLGSLLVALSWWAFGDSDMVPGLFKIVWKAIPLAMLAIYAFQRHLGSDGTILSGMLAIAAMADGMSQLAYTAAATLMAFSFLLAIWLYSRNRRDHVVFSQKLLAGVLIGILPALAWFLLMGEIGQVVVTGYALLLGIMAAMAWTSRFSRYRVGLGAVLLVIAGLMFFAITGPILRGSPLLTILIWPIYYAGQLMIATGVVGRMRRDLAA